MPGDDRLHLGQGPIPENDDGVPPGPVPGYGAVERSGQIRIDVRVGAVQKVYLPVYGVPALDAAARQTYESQGFQVVEIPAALLSTRLGGGIRCAAGELDVLQ
ncbi:MAG: hypothetical protein AB1758_12485 [Candidatus Eremiobacterota bacterium]